MKSALFRLIFALALAALFSDCTTSLPSPRGQTVYLEGLTIPPRPRPSYTPVEDTFSYWEDDGSGGPPRLKIDLSEQAAYFFRGNHLVGRARISSGDESHPTPAGEFTITQKDHDHKSSLYGDFIDRETGEIVVRNIDIRTDKPPAGCVFDAAKMTWFMQFYPATGMHAGFLPGYPASHGCVRLPDWLAKRFYDNTPIGTPLTVVH
jgi:hypothetical protein